MKEKPLTTKSGILARNNQKFRTANRSFPLQMEGLS
jgi:hypothetical protein